MITEWTYFDFKKKIVYLQNIQEERDIFFTVAANVKQHIIFSNDFIKKGRKTVRMVDFRDYTLKKCKAAEKIFFQFDCRSKNSVFYGTNRMSETQFVFLLKNIKGIINEQNFQQLHDFHFIEYLYCLSDINKLNAKKNNSVDNQSTFFIKVLEKVITELKKNGLNT